MKKYYDVKNNIYFKTFYCFNKDLNIHNHILKTTEVFQLYYYFREMCVQIMKL